MVEQEKQFQQVVLSPLYSLESSVQTNIVCHCSKPSCIPVCFYLLWGTSLWLCIPWHVCMYAASFVQLVLFFPSGRQLSYSVSFHFYTLSFQCVILYLHFTSFGVIVTEIAFSLFCFFFLSVFGRETPSMWWPQDKLQGLALFFQEVPGSLVFLNFTIIFHFLNYFLRIKFQN